MYLVSEPAVLPPRHLCHLHLCHHCPHHHVHCSCPLFVCLVEVGQQVPKLDHEASPVLKNRLHMHLAYWAINLWAASDQAHWNDLIVAKVFWWQLLLRILENLNTIVVMEVGRSNDMIVALRKIADRLEDLLTQETNRRITLSLYLSWLTHF